MRPRMSDGQSMGHGHDEQGLVTRVTKSHRLSIEVVDCA